MARTLGRPRQSKAKKLKGRFIIISARQSTLPDGKILPEVMTEDREALLFDTYGEAMTAGRAAPWANAWPWFVVELVNGGDVSRGNV